MALSKKFFNKQFVQTTLAITASVLAVAGFVYGATVIGTNISVDGNLAISGTSATSTFSTGGLTVGTDQFVVQQTSGRVGIGTTSPFAKLGIQNVASGTDSYAVYIASSTGSATNNYGLNIADQTVGTYNWNIWSGPAYSGLSAYIQNTTKVLSQNVFVSTLPGSLSTALLGLVEENNPSPGNTYRVGTEGYTVVNFSGAGNADLHEVGVQGEVDFIGSGSTPQLFAVNAVPYIQSGSVTDFVGFHVDTYLGGIAGGAVTNFYGLLIDDITGASNNYAIKTGLGKVSFGDSVGIGTTTPQWLLNPYSATAPQLALSAGAGLSQWAFRNAGGNLYLATTTTNGTATTTTSALTILNSGNLGIGTTSPTKLLSVVGDTYIAGTGTTTLNLKTTTASKGTCIEMFDSGGSVRRLYINAAGAITVEAGTCK